MALINCPECGKQISDKAAACIHCGCPLGHEATAASKPIEPIEKIKEPASAEDSENKKSLLAGLIILCLAGLAAMFILFSDSGSGVAKDPDDALTKSEFISLCSTVDYKSIARNPNEYKGERVKVVGTVLQSVEDGRQITLIIRVNDEFFDFMYVTYENKLDDERFLDEDWVSIYGKLDGLKTYDSIGVGEVTVPKMNAKYIDILS